MSKSENKKNEQLQSMKVEIANKMGIDLNKPNLTAKEAGSVGGQMVKQMIENEENKMR